MKVCVNCFSDKELKGFISSSSEIGDCAVCESKNQPLLDVSELFDFFQELVDNFKIDENGMPLSSKIQSNWSFFSSHGSANKILNYVLPNLQTEVISSNINVEYTDDIIENYNQAIDWYLKKIDVDYLLIDNYQNQLSIRFADITPYNFISSNKKDINKQYRSFTMEDTGTCKFKLVDNKQVEFENYEHLLNQILEFINLNFTHIKNNIDIKSEVIYTQTDLEVQEIEVKKHFKSCFLKEISDNKNLYNYIKNHYLFKKLNNDLSNKNKTTKHKI